MKKDMLRIKQKLLELCKQNQMKMVESAKTAMNEAQHALSEYGAAKDRYDSFRDQLTSRRDMFALQYQKALSDVNILEMIDCHRLKERLNSVPS